MATTNGIKVPHIRLDERGVAYVDDSRFKVVHVIREYLAGASPDEIRKAYPDSLTLAQVFACLTYYYDHQTEIDDHIRRADEMVNQMRKDHKNPLTREQLMDGAHAKLLALGGTWSEDDLKEFQAATAHLGRIDSEHWK